ncbi:GNAT family N-acetyltransferase [Candidatus Ferrigenium straubiae]|uniref:GNAT family N-acetyltransferase n=1 Tax=Candidatus Ferrigenium straubiae TaxID=2919506 RepID=UPI003F4A86F0
MDHIPSGSLPIYFTQAYQSLFAEHDGAKTVSVCINDGVSEWYLPLLLRKIGDRVYEAYTAYGYGGILSATGSTVSMALLEKLRKFLQEENVVCAFIRHSPFLGNQEWLPRGQSEFNRTTYVRTLTQGGDLDKFSASSPQKLRWSINYARRHDLMTHFHPLKTCKESLIREFYSIYHGLMDGKKTNNYYLFSEEFFQKHALHFGDNCELAAVHDPSSGKLIAAAFFLLDGADWAHYHLSASHRDFMKLQPVELMMAEATLRYGNAGYRNLHLGGGHAADESDGLSRFKKKFATESRPFHLSRWVCDDIRYQAERARLTLKYPNFFLISDARGEA